MNKNFISIYARDRIRYINKSEVAHVEDVINGIMTVRLKNGDIIHIPDTEKGPWYSFLGVMGCPLEDGGL